MAAPELIVVGGANGSGKTTFASRYHKALGVEFLNADNIASTLSNQGVANAMIAAGRMFFTRLNELLDEGRTFVVETTLSGSYINKVALKARRMGFRVVTVFIFLDSAELCVERVASRIVKGGHEVPTTDIIRRFSRANQNFRQNFTPLSDTWLLLYNGGDSFQEVASSTGDGTRIINPHRFAQFQSL